MSSRLIELPWGSQPQEAVEVDWSNPRTRGLALAFPLNGNTANAVSGRRALANNNPAYVATRNGLGLGLTGGSQWLSVSSADFTPSNTAWAYALTAQIDNNGAVNPLFGAWDSSGSGRHLYFHVTSASLFVDVPFKEGIINVSPPNAGVPRRWMVTRNGSTITVYVDGLAYASGTITTTQETPANPVLFGGAGGGSSSSLGSVILLPVAYTRGLSAEEAREDAERSWQLFAPRRIFVPVAAAGGGASTITPASGTSTASALVGSSTAQSTPSTAAGVSTASSLTGRSTAAAAISPAAGVSTAQTLAGVAGSGSTITPAAGASTAATLTGRATAAGAATPAAGTSTASTLTGRSTAAATITPAAGQSTTGTLVPVIAGQSVITQAAGISTTSELAGSSVAVANIEPAAGVSVTGILIGTTAEAAPGIFYPVGPTRRDIGLPVFSAADYMRWAADTLGRVAATGVFDA